MFWWILSGCVSPGMAVDFFLAKDAEWTVDPDSVCDQLNCRFDEVDEVLNVIPEVEGVVEVVNIDPTVFTLRGLVAGDTIVSISGLDRGNDLVERYMHVYVAPVQRFGFGLRCDAHAPSDDPWVLPVEASVDATWFLYDAANNRLEGGPQFESDGVSWSDVNPSSNRVTLTMPPSAGDAVLGSGLMNDDVAQFSVVTEDQYDGFAAEVWSIDPISVGEGASVDTAMLIDGRRVCVDRVVRVLTTSTPDVCGFWDGSPEWSVVGSEERLTVQGLAPGTCLLEVSVPDFGWSESLTLEVAP